MLHLSPNIGNLSLDRLEPLVSFGAPKRKVSSVSHSSHRGIRSDSGTATVKIVLLSRLFREKDLTLLENSAAFEDGLLLISKLQEIMLTLCTRETRGKTPSPSISDMRTLFRLTGSALSHAKLYEAQLSLPSRLPMEAAKIAYQTMLEMMGTVKDTTAGMALYHLLTREAGSPRPRDAPGKVVRVIEELRQILEVVNATASASDPLTVVDGVVVDPDSVSSSSFDTRSTRSLPVAKPVAIMPLPPPLASSVRDATGRLVYVDGRTYGDSEALRTALRESTPSDDALKFIDPVNRNRLLFDIRSPEAIGAFSVWLRAAVESNSAMAEMLNSIADEAGKVLLLGFQFIIPKVSGQENEIPEVEEQEFHTDVSSIGEVLAVGLHTHDLPMNTLIDALGSTSLRSPFLGRAATSIYMFDTGVVHAGPGKKDVTGPYPVYFKDRVFFLLASPSLSMERITKHRKDNRLKRMPLLLNTRNTQQPATERLNPNLSLAGSILQQMETRIGRAAKTTEENTFFKSMLEALTPLPSSDDEHRVRLLVGGLLEGLADPAGAQLHASVAEVVRVSLGQASASIPHLCELVIANTGAVAGLSLLNIFS